ncbi:hydrocephalus-inducing protein homolog [Macrosteles quadrilineatus]|uniref:hydrocephalus-inducing protein homolog n=1 Tax=Macrosteles quadrilineatus TaxID=74068 RepID=UPI0023E2C64B|nr:hydrocephalus-inducing protein homolog [Macrosteles quadrilineatus]
MLCANKYFDFDIDIPHVDTHPAAMFEKGVYQQPLQLEVAGWRRQYHLTLEAVCDIPHVDTHPAAMFEKVVFDPEVQGVYQQPLQLEVAGWRRQYHLTLEAVCDIPHVDTHPAAMFEKGVYQQPLQLEVAGWRRQYHLTLEAVCDIPHVDTHPAAMFEKGVYQQPLQLEVAGWRRQYHLTLEAVCDIPHVDTHPAAMFEKGVYQQPLQLEVAGWRRQYHLTLEAVCDIPHVDTHPAAMFETGVYQQPLHLEVAGWRRQYHLTLEAVCDIPHVDTHPAAMFEKGVYQQPLHLEVAGWRRQYHLTLEAVCDIPHVDTHPAAMFEKPLQLEVAGWRRQYHLTLEAVCDIPHVDTHPAAMFEKVIDSLSPTSISQCVFLNNEKIFYFGPVFATPANKDRTNDLTTNFYFTNISAVNVEMDFAFVNVENRREGFAFGFKPNQLHILPGETKALEVFACPTVVGKHKASLVYSIANNSNPGVIEMSCIGIKPEFEYEPKEIRFERVLLYRKEFSELTLSNLCYKPLGWRLVDLSLLSKQISISQQSGVISAMQSSSVYINFLASYVEVSKNVIHIEVYDDQFRGSPFVSEPIPVILEAIDVLVDVMFPAGCEDSELKFQSVKVGVPESQIVALKNLGKYDVTFSIKFNEECKTHFDLDQVFTFTPKSGTLPKMGKSVPVQITCMCTKPVHLKKAPVVKVWLVDTGPGAQPVAAIPINVTINAFSSQYKVFPQSELNFSSMLVGTRKVEHIVIENVGKFEFMFQIQTVEQEKLEKLEPKQSVKAALSTKSKSKGSGQSSVKTGIEKVVAKSKGRREDTWGTMTVGAFTLSHSRGLVMPGKSFKIDVECYVSSQDTFCEELVIKVMEYAWMKREGTHIKLKAVSYLPFINFENVQNIFQEASPFGTQGHLLVEGDPNISYDADHNVLHFTNGCVGSQAVMNLHLHLYNSGLVPCEATAVIISDNEPAVFYATPDKFTIMSHSELTVTLAFRPTQIGVFEEILEVRVALPSPLEPQVFKTQLIGEAYLPRITVLSPPHPYKLTFPPTLVGDSSEETIRFVNNGNINCSIIIEMLTNKNSGLSFYSDSTSVIKGSLYQVQLKTGEEASVVARFSPAVAGTVMGEVRLMVTNNPYEDTTVVTEAVGYTQDIVVEGLPLVRR